MGVEKYIKLQQELKSYLAKCLDKGKHEKLGPRMHFVMQVRKEKYRMT